jgi:hypothetical protein
MVRRNAAGTKLYLYCIKGETHSVLAVDGTGAINEIACPEPCTDLVLDSEEGIVGWYNFALQTLTTKDEKHSLTNVVAFKHDRKGEYFAYKSGSEPTSIRISSFSAPESVLAHTEYTGAFDIFSNDKNVFVTVTEGFGRPLNFFRYAIESNMITLTEKRAILHPKSKGIVRPALHPLDMDVDAEVLLCTLEYDCPLAALSRMYLFDISSGEFSSQVQTQGRSFLLQQCVPLCVTDSSSPKSPAR